MIRVREIAARVVSGCGMVLMGLFGAPAVLLLAIANGIRKGFDRLSEQIEK